MTERARIGVFLRFFQRCWMVAGLLLAHADTPIQGQRHDQQSSVEPIRSPSLEIFPLKNMDFIVSS